MLFCSILRSLCIFWLALLLVLSQAAFIFAQNDTDKINTIEQRLQALEKHLGIQSADTKNLDLDTILQRLDTLEHAVFDTPNQETSSSTTIKNETKIPAAESEPAAPPPESGENLDWQAWDGSEVDLLEYQQEAGGES